MSWLRDIFKPSRVSSTRGDPGEPAATARAGSNDFTYVYTVRVADQDRHVVSILPPGAALKQGIPILSVLGWLIKSPIEGGKLTPDNFLPNRLFVDFLSRVIARHAPESMGLWLEAIRQGDGAVCILDPRTPNPAGDLAQMAEDIIGYFLVTGGKIDATSYQHNGNHRLVSERGVMKLEPFLKKRLLQELRELPPTVRN